MAPPVVPRRCRVERISNSPSCVDRGDDSLHDTCFAVGKAQGLDDRDILHERTRRPTTARGGQRHLEEARGRQNDLPVHAVVGAGYGSAVGANTYSNCTTSCSAERSDAEQRVARIAAGRCSADGPRGNQQRSRWNA